MVRLYWSFLSAFVATAIVWGCNIPMEGTWLDKDNNAFTFTSNVLKVESGNPFKFRWECDSLSTTEDDDKVVMLRTKLFNVRFYKCYIFHNNSDTSMSYIVSEKTMRKDTQPAPKLCDICTFKEDDTDSVRLTKDRNELDKETSSSPEKISFSSCIRDCQKTCGSKRSVDTSELERLLQELMDLEN